VAYSLVREHHVALAASERMVATPS